MKLVLAKLRSRNLLWPLWTKSSNENETPPVSGLSVECRESLRKIATLFKRVNGVVFNEAEREQRQFDDEKKISLAPSLTRRSQSLYLETEILFLHYRGQLVIPSTDSDSVHDLLRYLSGEAPLDAELIVWRKAVGTLLEHQGPAVYNSEPHWAMAKAQAHDILDFRNDAAELFDEIYQELTLKHLYEVRESISLRLRMLEKFVAIYDRQPTPYNDSYNPPPEPRYELFPLPSKQRRKKISKAYSTAQFQHNSHLVIIVPIVILAQFIPIALAWQRSSSQPGSTSDADFWLLVQSTAMQLLGIFTAIYALYENHTGTAWRWTQGLTILGVSCSVAAIPLYLYFPTMWSVLVSFFGSAAQALMAVQLALMAASVVTQVKED